MKLKYIPIISILAFVLFAGVAHAQIACGPTVEVEPSLTGNWGEVIVRKEPVPDGMLELWKNKETGTWTIIKNMGSMSCIMDAGQDMPQPKAPEKGA
jgi:hypothetical protein